MHTCGMLSESQHRFRCKATRDVVGNDLHANRYVTLKNVESSCMHGLKSASVPDVYNLIDYFLPAKNVCARASFDGQNYK